MIVRKARRYIKLNYQIRNFNELGKFKQYLLYAYLKRNGFITREDLDKLILFIQSQNKQVNEFKKWNLLGIVMSVFIAVFLAIFGGSFLFQVFDGKSRVIVALIIIILAVVFYYLGKMMEQLFRHFTKKEARLSFHLVRQIIAIQTVLLTSENTEYSPFLAIEKKVQENPFLQEIILSKSFL
ncbi:ABC transporter ATP-binding protein [Listeria goaensis]|uniref:ABC transporter ATP-binding protein n=2 Tax=Listeriaceae TaxID=186820 RepID=UPI001F084DA4|nr:ABC transporter ATP-binding protein [Listeria goaensis]